MQQIWAKKRTFIKVGFPDRLTQIFFSLKNYHLANTQVVVAVII